MPLIFIAPVVSTRDGNPATNLTVNGVLGAEFLGYTEPRLNNNPMVNKSAGGNLRVPVNLNSPTFNFAADAKVGRVRATVTAPTNTVSWNIVMPPDCINGVWTSIVTQKGLELKRTLFPHIVGGSSLMGMPPLADWKVVLHPLPTPQAFKNHILWHENQHAADHRWLAEQIIGPWTDWYDFAQNNNITFRRKSSNAELESALRISPYAESPSRIGMYWQDCIHESGDLFHATPLGRVPTLKVRKVVGTPRIDGGNFELHLTVEAAQLIAGVVTHLSPPHTLFTLEPANIDATKNGLRGCEKKLAPGVGVPPARSLMAFQGLNAIPQNGICKIAGVPEDEDFPFDLFGD